jgi:hypothetical protein
MRPVIKSKEGRRIARLSAAFGVALIVMSRVILFSGRLIDYVLIVGGVLFLAWLWREKRREQ